MLDAALKYREAIDKVTAAQGNGLRRWELNAREWEIATQLRDILKVSHSVTLSLWVHSSLTNLVHLPAYLLLPSFRHCAPVLRLPRRLPCLPRRLLDACPAYHAA